MRGSQSHRIAKAGATLLLFLTTACAAPESDPATTLVRDSAGMIIVENFLVADSLPALAWDVSANPTLQIGAVEGAPEYQLSSVRGARRLSNGDIAVADGGSGLLRFYGPDGRHLRSVGGSGSGPGEFQEIIGILVVRDSVLAYDMSLQRLTAFSFDGRVGSTTSIRAPNANPAGVYVATPLGVIGQELLMVPNGGLFPRMAPAQLIWHDWGSAHLFRRDGTRLSPLGESVGAEFFVAPEFSMGAPFARRTVSAYSTGRLHMADGMDYEIRIYEEGTTPSRVIRLARPSTPVTRELSARFVEEILALIPDERRPEYRERYALLLYPSHLPTTERIQADSRGNTWLGEYVLPWEEGDRRWIVFDPDGRLLGYIFLPYRLEITEIGEDYILGVWQDDLEVEYVRMYNLSRTGRSG